MKTEIISIEDYKKLKSKKKNKFGAIKVQYKGLNFDSKIERDYYILLEFRLKKNKIKKIELHKRIDLMVNGQLICFIKPDFTIVNNDDSISYHDTKGVVTPLFKLKAKLFKSIIGKGIKIITRKNF